MKSKSKSENKSETDKNKENSNCKHIIKTGKNKGKICNKENCKNHNKQNKKDLDASKHLEKDKLIELYKITYDYNEKISKFNKENNCKIRLSGFSEVLSENMIKFFLIENNSLDCVNSPIGGDLLIRQDDKCLKVECKCFTSEGPMSFGPTEAWDILMILDATLYKENKYTLYRINLANTDKEWENLKITNDKTFKDAIANKNNRPHFSFKFVKEQLKNFTEVLANKKTFDEIINKNKENELTELTKNLKEKCVIENNKEIVV